MTQIEDAQVLRAESVTLGLLGRLLYEPEQVEIIRAALHEGLFDELPYGQDQAAARQGEAQIQQWAELHGSDDVVRLAREVANEHFNLYLGVGTPPVPIWESVYFNDAGLVFQRQMLDVRARYKARGLQNAKKNKEPDDHLGLELLFVSRCAQEAAEALESGSLEVARLLLAQHDEFLCEHTLCWALDWSALTVQKSDSPWFKGLAYMVTACMEEVAQRRSLVPRHIPHSRGSASIPAMAAMEA